MYSRDKILNVMRDIHEESKQISPYVVIAQPRRVKSETAAQKLDGYEGLHIDLLGFSHGFCDIYGEKVDVARNYLIERALESGAKYLFFVGEDTVIPYDGFKILHETAEKNPNSIVVGVYYIKCSDAMIMTRVGDHIIIPNCDPGQIFEAWQTGMDAMLIPIELLKKMKDEDPELPFCCIGSQIEDIPFIGEDNFFVHRARRLGIKLLVDTNVQCLHMDLASGKYTAHPSVDLKKYYTNIPVTVPLTMDDKQTIDKRWIDRLPKSHTNILDEYIKNNKSIKFNMGCGQDKLEGYIGIDINSKTADIREDILTVNLPENCADEILASHVVEHIPQHRIVELLTKWNNTLKPNGKLIVEQPNLQALCEDFIKAEGEDKWFLTMCMFGAFVEEHTPDTQEKGALSPHLFAYYPEAFHDLLKDIGFNNIEILPVEGLHPGKNFRVEATK